MFYPDFSKVKLLFMTISSVSISYEKLIDIEDVSCNLLTVRSKNYTTKIIINTGIQNNFDYSIYTEKVQKVIKEADCILLTSFDIGHFGGIGLFSNITKEKDIAAPMIYCTVPTATIGKFMMDDAHEKAKNLLKMDQNIVKEEVKNDLNLTILKYAQPIFINDLEILGYNCGNVLGNTFFIIKYNSNSNDPKVIGVGYDINLKRDNFLDGFNYFSDIDVLITNDSYVTQKDDNVTEKNTFLRSFVEKVPNTIIFVVNISRLIELLLSIRENICVVSNLSFIDRIRSMIEWAGVNGVEILEKNFAFSTLSNLKKRKVMVVVSDYLNDVYLGSLLEEVESYELIYLNGKNSSDMFNAYNFEYKVEKDENFNVSDEESAEDVIEDELNLKQKWYDKSSTVFLNNKNISTKFKRKLRPVHDCEFGKVFEMKFINQQNINAIDLDEIIVEEKIVETFTFEKTIQAQNISRNKFVGVSSLANFENLCRELNVKYLMVESNNSENFNIIKNCVSYYNTNLYVEQIKKLSQSKLSLTYEEDQIMELPEEFYDQKLKQMGNTHIGIFDIKVKKEENYEIETIGAKNEFAVQLSNFDIKRIKELLIQSGFKVEMEENGILIEEAVHFKIKNNVWEINSSDMSLANAVRDFIYKAAFTIGRRP